MLFDDNEPGKAWICEAAWGVITEKKMIKPGEQLIQEYKDMEFFVFSEKLKQMDRVVKPELKAPSKNLKKMTSIMG
jgi:hypothetical protein